jgi:integrase
MTKRRAKGDGSVYQKKDGRYTGEYTDANGKRRYVSGKSKADVKTKIRTALANKEVEIVTGPENLNVEKFMDRWLEVTKDTVKPNTWRPYEAITRLHIKPTLGKVKLEKLNALQLQSLYRDKLNSSLSPRRVQYIHVTVRKALSDAVRWQLVRTQRHLPNHYD